jgi:predicted DNA-binding protein with PD1-like motif
VSFHVHRPDKVRHLVIRASAGGVLPDGLMEALRQEGVVSGWVRATGVLADVSLRAYASEADGLGTARLIAGPLQAVTLEGSVGIVDGAASCSLSAVLARETSLGLETFAGQIVSARAVALEIFVTGFDDPPAVVSTSSPGWSAALVASADADRPSTPARQVRPSPHGQHGQHVPMPSRPVRPEVDLDVLAPEAGDVVDHFAFGRCDVVKSDGDRLHLRIHKDGRVREIALEMLRVIGLSDDSERPRRFKLERRI